MAFLFLPLVLNKDSMTKVCIKGDNFCPAFLEVLCVKVTQGYISSSLTISQENSDISAVVFCLYVTLAEQVYITLRDSAFSSVWKPNTVISNVKLPCPCCIR